jgi:L-ascorbate metabolism protein UlaG (beta-lactamase superfamily)
MGRIPWFAGGLFVAMAGLSPPAAANCQLTAEASPRHLAAFRPAAAANSVNLRFLGHSSFRIETGAGVIVVTDFNGMLRVEPAPDIVTMNIAHSSHHTDRVDPKIKHVLRGWDPAGGMAKHDFTLRDLRVRNVPTDLRGFGAARPGANSIFVFEVADSCIAHLGHLHHRLTATHIAELGRVDVLMVPVDGGYTLDHQDMVEVMRQVGAPLNLPMHFFTAGNLAHFVDVARPFFAVAVGEPGGIALSRGNLPRRPTLLVLPEG